MKCINLVRALAIALCLSSCSMHRGEVQKIKLSNVRTPMPGVQVVDRDIARAQVSNALSHESAWNSLRLIEVYQSPSGSTGSYPEYRIFDVRAESIYALLGLQNGDILVAADDYVVFDAAVFKQFAKLLQSESNASIEIRREGKSMLFNYRIL